MTTRAKCGPEFPVSDYEEGFAVHETCVNECRGIGRERHIVYSHVVLSALAIDEHILMVA